MKPTTTRLIYLVAGSCLILALLIVASASFSTGNYNTRTLTPIDNIEMSPELGIVVNKNLQIVDVVPGSAAQQAGLQAGDVLQTIGNAPITSPGNAMQVVRQTIAQTPGQSITLTLQRGKTEINIQVSPSPNKGKPQQPTPTPVPSDYGYL